MITETNTSEGPAAGAPVDEIKIERIPVDKLHPSPTNPRKYFDAAALSELAGNIREHGVQMPLLARASKAEEGKLEIVAGERRYRATLELLEKIKEEYMTLPVGGDDPRFTDLELLKYERARLPVIVKDYSDNQVVEMQLIENLQREGLSPLEEAEGYKALLAFGYTTAEVAHKVGRKPAAVLAKLKLLRAPALLVDALAKKLVGENHLVLVATIPGEKQREACAKKIMAGCYDVVENEHRPLSVRQARELIQSEYRRDLSGAPFELGDAGLLPDAGACSNCAYFLAHAATMDADLAEELGGGQGGAGRGGQYPLTCMKPSCLDRKNGVWMERKAAESREAGGARVLSEKETVAVFTETGELKPSAQFVRLDDSPGYEHVGHYDKSKVKPWGDLVEGREAPADRVLANVPGFGVVELIDKDKAVELAKQHPEYGNQFILDGKAAKLKPSDEEKAKAEAERFEKRIEQRQRPVLLKFLHDAYLNKGGVLEASLRVLECALYEAGLDGNRLLCETWKIEAKGKPGEQLSQAHYRDAILAYLRRIEAGKQEVEAWIMLANVSKWVKAWGVKISMLAPLQECFAFDEKTIRALAVAELKDEDKGKAKKKKDADKVAVNDSTDPHHFSTDAEAEKTAAADEIGKSKLVPPESLAGESAGEFVVFGNVPESERADLTHLASAGFAPGEDVSSFKDDTGNLVGVIVATGPVEAPALLSDEDAAGVIEREPVRQDDNFKTVPVHVAPPAANFDLETAAKQLADGEKTVAELIGSQPTRSKDEAAYKAWNKLRGQLRRKAGLQS